MGRRSSTGDALDEVDRRLLELLVEDGRMSVNELAARAHISRAAAYVRFDRLRESGAITGFSATVDPDRVGLPVSALILLNVDQPHWEDVRDELRGIPGIEYMAFTSGAFDMVLLVRLPDVHSLRDIVLDRLHHSRYVRTTHTVFVLDEQRLPVPPATPAGRRSAP